jgi:voltage-gated sodium channel
MDNERMPAMTAISPRNLFLRDRFILLLIMINALIIFTMGFSLSHGVMRVLAAVDQIITVLFVVEMAIKIRYHSFGGYWSSMWNRMDFILIFLSLPSLLLYVTAADGSAMSYLLVLRVTRLFKTFRTLKFIPGIEELVAGVRRAMRASVIVFLGFGIYIFLIGILCFYLFRDASAEYFGDPLLALYSTFKIFTVEGWYEIPESIAAGMQAEITMLIYAFFAFILLSGGIFGLSLVNSIFVDAMVADNNDELEKKVDALDAKVTLLLQRQQESTAGNGPGV